jgi:flagellar basal body-associated protein FliL
MRGANRRGWFWIIMFGIIFLALIALMQAFHTLVTVQQEMQEDRKSPQQPPRWTRYPEHRR